MGRIKMVLKRTMNIPNMKNRDKPSPISGDTYDILVRAKDQGERLAKMEGPHKVRTGNPFGDILERRVDKVVSNV